MLWECAQAAASRQQCAGVLPIKQRERRGQSHTPQRTQLSKPQGRQSRPAGTPHTPTLKMGVMPLRVWFLQAALNEAGSYSMPKMALPAGNVKYVCGV